MLLSTITNGVNPVYIHITTSTHTVEKPKVLTVAMAIITGEIKKSLSVLSTESALCKMAVDRELRISTEP